MSALEPVVIPDLGDIDQVEVIELPIKAGDVVKRDDVLVVLESDKASMEVVAPRDGTLSEIYVKEGDSVTSGQQVAALLLLGADEVQDVSVASVAEAVGASPVPAAPAVAPAASPAPVASSAPVVAVSAPAAGGPCVENVPDLGDIDSAAVIEVCVAVGDSVNEGDPLIVLESDKASMEVPASRGGTIAALLTKVGDQLTSGSPVVEITQSGVAASVPANAPVVLPSGAPAVAAAPAATPSSPSAAPASKPVSVPKPASSGELSAIGDTYSANVSASVHAGPAVRRLASELFVDLSQVTGSGPRNRILKEDVHQYVKQKMKSAASAPANAAGGGVAAVALPEVDFSQWGPTEEKPLSRIQKLSAQYLHRSWSVIPHVTQFEEADITDLEAFRQSQKDVYAKKGIKLTPLAFIMKACALTLAQHPKFKASLKADGATLVHKSYCHMGFACETPGGLVVPVVRDVDQKSISELAQEVVALSAKARENRLKPNDMKGAVFSVSSLGGIGGTAFTPIVNWPEVAILGVSKNIVKPVWNGETFVPRTCVPLSLSYDHRVIDGADAARFTTSLKGFLEDLRQWML